MSSPASSRRHAPAAERNKDPILYVLRAVLPARARMLEVGSGAGTHGAHFVAREPGWIWQPTDVSPEALASIASWHDDPVTDGRLLAPVALDVRERPWAVPTASYDAVFCANVIHISPWACAVGLIEGAADVLAPGGALVTYGPYRIDGAHTAESNAAFDADLRARDPSWGVRDLEELRAVAGPAGLELEARHPMPANNFTLVFRRR